MEGVRGRGDKGGRYKGGMEEEDNEKGIKRWRGEADGGEGGRDVGHIWNGRLDEGRELG